jgi:hypothetical protein
MNANGMTGEQWREIVRDLEGRLRGHQETLAGIEARRRLHALKAALGDTAAIAEMAEIEREEQTATAGRRDTTFALDAARRQQSNTAQREFDERERSRKSAAV